MNSKLIGLKSVFLREIELIRKDFDLIVILLISPIFYVFFYGSFYINKSENNVPIVIIDNDHSELSRNFIRYLDSHQLIEVKAEVRDFQTAQDQIYKMEAFGIIYIPANFESSLKGGLGTDLKVFINTSRFLISNDINKAITEVSEYLGAGVRLKFFETKGYNFEQARQLIEPLKSDIKPMFNQTESYGDFLIPAIFILILQQTLLFGLSQSIAKEREKNTVKDLYRTANRSMWATITGKSSFYFLLYFSYAIFFFIVPFSVFKLSFNGSLITLLIMTVFLLLSVIYLSFFIGSFFKKKVTSLLVLVFTSYPVFFITGYAWPSDSLPAFLNILAQFVPSTPYFHAYVRITQMGAGFEHVLPEFVHLLILAIACLVGTRIRMKILIRKTTDEPIVSPLFTIAEKILK